MTSTGIQATVAAEGRFDGYVHAEADRLVDGRGTPLLMRGVGLGNWLLPEGYMWCFEGGPQSPRQIEALIVDLVGPELARRFWRAFEEAFITEADIARIAAEGFDHVRLPINARGVIDDEGALIDRGLELIDRTIEWCRGHGLWVILDLHGAPGGQTGTNIDDSPRGRPELFEDSRYRELTVALWRALAHRYVDETVVAGYDLLNEPLPEEWQHRYPDRLVDLYRELTGAIRAVDPHHLIIYEGTHWATNWDIFTEVWDANSMLQFHKYWSPPDRLSIRTFVTTGQRLGLPIYMGEGGENGLDWLQTAFQLYEDHGISWNLWPWKKVDTRTSPVSVVPPAGWDAIVAYAAGDGPRPDAEKAAAVLEALVEAMQLDACEYRTEVVHAVMRRAPLRLPAAGFGFRGASHSVSGTPLRGFRADDAVTVRVAGGAPEPETLVFRHVRGEERTPAESFELVLQPGEWVVYEVNAGRPARFVVLVAVADDGLGEPTVAIDGASLAIVHGGDGWSGEVELGQGRHELRLGARSDACVVRHVEVRSAGSR